MPELTPYETIYFTDLFFNRPKPLVEEPIMTMTELEMAYMEGARTLLNPDGIMPPYMPPGSFWYKPDIPETDRHGLPASPILPEPTDDVMTDAQHEFKLIRTLNATGNVRARRDFINVQRYLEERLNEKERNMLKLADFAANESMEHFFQPGMTTAMGILRDYWPRWFGRKADTHARYNPDIYWIPWSFFMEDSYINQIKNDLVSNLFNQKAKDALHDELFKQNKLDNKINEFDFTTEHPLMWKEMAYQTRVAQLHYQYDSIINHKYWTLGNFSINAIPQGTVMPLKEGGHRICVSAVHIFIHDTFNFEGWAPLGAWDPESKLFPAISKSTFLLFNTNFREFRERHGYGKNFTVQSPLYKVPDFEGICWDVK